MFAQPHARGARRIALAVVLTAAVGSIVPATAAPDSPVASAAAKACGGGKVLVRRPGRSSVCAKRCPSGTKRKVSRRGKLSCVKRKGKAAPSTPPPNSAPQSPPMGDAPPAADGPKRGGYSGETEQSRPVTFTVSGGEVVNFEAGVNTYCSTQGNQRIVFDAIANVPPMAIGPDGSFSYTGDESNGNVKIDGRVVGNTATGTVGMNRGDTNYDYADKRTYFGSCTASDIKWSAAAG